jgi:hypothetical protein
MDDDLIITKKVKRTNTHSPLIILGAINQNEEYILPTFANKKQTYCCPECKTSVIFKHGDKNIPHFAHKNKNNCTHYDSPNETQIHKGAKEFLAQLIRTKHTININRHCKNKKCKQNILDSQFEYLDDALPIIECPIDYCSICNTHDCNHKNKRKKCDIAYVDSEQNVHSIIEIIHSHSTDENTRPEPWFEFKAQDIANIKTNENITLKCNRKILCQQCINDANNELKNINLESLVIQNNFNVIMDSIKDQFNGDINNMLNKFKHTYDDLPFDIVITHNNDNTYFNITDKMLNITDDIPTFELHNITDLNYRQVIYKILDILHEIKYGNINLKHHEYNNETIYEILPQKYTPKNIIVRLDEKKESHPITYFDIPIKYVSLTKKYNVHYDLIRKAYYLYNIDIWIGLFTLLFDKIIYVNNNFEFYKKLLNDERFKLKCQYCNKYFIETIQQKDYNKKLTWDTLHLCVDNKYYHTNCYKISKINNDCCDFCNKTLFKNKKYIDIDDIKNNYIIDNNNSYHLFCYNNKNLIKNNIETLNNICKYCNNCLLDDVNTYFTNNKKSSLYDYYEKINNDYYHTKCMQLKIEDICNSSELDNDCYICFETIKDDAKNNIDKITFQLNNYYGKNENNYYHVSCFNNINDKLIDPDLQKKCSICNYKLINNAKKFFTNGYFKNNNYYEKINDKFYHYKCIQYKINKIAEKHNLNNYCFICYKNLKDDFYKFVTKNNSFELSEYCYSENNKYYHVKCYDDIYDELNNNCFYCSETLKIQGNKIIKQCNYKKLKQYYDKKNDKYYHVKCYKELNNECYICDKILIYKFEDLHTTNNSITLKKYYQKENNYYYHVMCKENLNNKINNPELNNKCYFCSDVLKNNAEHFFTIHRSLTISDYFTKINNKYCHYKCQNTINQKINDPILYKTCGICNNILKNNAEQFFSNNTESHKYYKKHKDNYYHIECIKSKYGEENIPQEKKEKKEKIKYDKCYYCKKNIFDINTDDITTFQNNYYHNICLYQNCNKCKNQFTIYQMISHKC